MNLLDALKIVRHIVNAICMETPAPRNSHQAKLYAVVIRIKQILEEAHIDQN